MYRLQICVPGFRVPGRSTNNKYLTTKPAETGKCVIFLIIVKTKFPFIIIKILFNENGV